LLKHSSLVEDDYEIKHTIRRQPFQWKPNVPDVISNNSTKIVPCRNSVQGKLLIVDERGKFYEDYLLLFFVFNFTRIIYFYFLFLILRGLSTVTFVLYCQNLQYSQRHSVINHCDRRITLLSDTNIPCGLFNLFTYFDMRFGVIVSSTLNVKEILKIYLIEQKIYIQITKMSDASITVIYHSMSLTVL
jgi:hypothetical protein